MAAILHQLRRPQALRVQKRRPAGVQTTILLDSHHPSIRTGRRAQASPVEPPPTSAPTSSRAPGPPLPPPSPLAHLASRTSPRRSWAPGRTPTYVARRHPSSRSTSRHQPQEAAALRLLCRNEFLEACDKELQRVEEFFQATYADLLAKCSKVRLTCIIQRDAVYTPVSNTPVSNTAGERDCSSGVARVACGRGRCTPRRPSGGAGGGVGQQQPLCRQAVQPPDQAAAGTLRQGVFYLFVYLFGYIPGMYWYVLVCIGM